MTAQFTKGEILIAFKDNISTSEKDAAVQGFGLAVKRSYVNANAYLVSVPVGTEEDWVKKFEQLPSVASAELNHILTFC
jgi:hypothetical protein